MTNQHSLGQYFTTNNILKNKVYEFIFNNPSIILEPSIGQGDLISFIKYKTPNIYFDMYEIDTNIKLLDNIKKKDVIYGDFMKQQINKKYETIIGTPPYVRTTKGNLYIDFIEKCYDLLDYDGELIFIIPSDLALLTIVIFGTVFSATSPSFINLPHEIRNFSKKLRSSKLLSRSAIFS